MQAKKACKAADMTARDRTRGDTSKITRNREGEEETGCRAREGKQPGLAARENGQAKCGERQPGDDHRKA